MNTRPKRSLFRMQNLRRVVQILVFGLFLYLFLLTVGLYDPAAKRTVLAAGAPADVFFHIDPLLALSTFLSTWHFEHTMVLALGVAVLAALFGRFFCGWICPLGTCLDAADALCYRGRKAKSREQKPGKAHVRNVKYYVLAAVVVAGVFAGQVAYLLDPITIITRTLTLAVYPVVQLGMRTLAGVDFVSEHLPFLTRSSYIPSDVQYFFRLNFLAAAVFITIIGLNSIARRYWCRNLCPLGALLGLLSKASIMRRQVSSKCVKCSKCIPDCKMGAVLDDPTQYQAPECIYCYSCTHVCPTLATRIAPSAASEGYHSDLDLNRRRVLQAVGIGATIAVLGKTNAAAKTSRAGNVKTSSEYLIRPPGALPEDEFTNRCVRCSECMKVCPTGGLQPAMTEAGLAGLWTPVLVPRIGECTQNCNLCSQVCSPKAIEPFEISEKPHLYIGRAVIDRSQCIAWNSDKQCLVCDEHCSYHAVHWMTVDGIRRPFVEEHKCVGCGICENACPIQPVAAIRAFSFGDRRHWTREQQQMFFDQRPRDSKQGGDQTIGQSDYPTGDQ